MYIEAIIVCVDYSDFLVHTLPQAKLAFDYIVVVTAKQDKETQQVCLHHNIECLQLDSCDKFDKAKAINEGLLYISKRDWVVCIDADIYLPAQTRQILQNKALDKKKIYGIDRLLCPDYKSWIDYIKKPRIIYKTPDLIYLDAFPISPRISEFNTEGYYPPGYFQLWHAQTSKVLLYPEESENCDKLFAFSWLKGNRELIGELIAIHLDSDNSKSSKWLSRNKPSFEQPNLKKRLSWLKVALWISLGLSIGSIITWISIKLNFVNF